MTAEATPNDHAFDDAQLFVERDMRGAETHRFPGGTAVIFSCASPHGDRVNQDAAAIFPVSADETVLVVADGVGGARAGAQASSLAVRELGAAIQARSDHQQGLRGAILDGFERANAAIAALGIGAATTMAVVLVEAGGAVRTFHVGDSAVLVAGQRGRIKLRTTSHSPVGYAVEAGLLGAEEALHHSERHLISNMVGAPDMHIDLGSTRALAPRDTLLVATDGLYDNLYMDEIVERIRKGPLARAAEALSRDALARMTEAQAGLPSKHDDLTFIAFRRSPPLLRLLEPGPAGVDRRSQ